MRLLRCGRNTPRRLADCARDRETRNPLVDESLMQKRPNSTFSQCGMVPIIRVLSLERHRDARSNACITLDRNGQAIIDKEHRGVRIYVRLGGTTQEEAQRRLSLEVQRVELELERQAGVLCRWRGSLLTRSHAINEPSMSRYGTSAC